MPRIPDEVIAEVKQATDIVDLISERVELKKQGHRLVGLCPFHSENSPSFSVSPEKGMYHCFGCGAGGNVFTFVMETEGLSFPETIERLATRANIAVEGVAGDEELTRDQVVRKQMRDAHRIIADLYHEVLMKTEAGEVGLTYLRERGLAEATIGQYKIGYAPDQRRFTVDSLERRGFDLEVMVEAGLISKSRSGEYFDRFEGRVVFPIADRDGTIVGFSGRAIDDRQPKYVNTAETPLFNKSELLFGFSQARASMRKQKRVLLVEGNVDVLQVAQAGTAEVVASLGTAFSSQHARALSRMVDEVVICYDGDHAGQEATLKVVRMLEAYPLDVQVLMLPEKTDPDDYIRTNGREQWQRFVESERLSVLDFMNRTLRRGKNMNREGERIRFIEAMLGEISKTDNSIRRDLYLKKLANEFDIPVETLANRMPRPVSSQVQASPAVREPEPIRKRSSKANEPRFVKAEKLLLRAMLSGPERVRFVRDRLGLAYQDEIHRMLATAFYEIVSEDMTLEEFEQVMPPFMERHCDQRPDYANRYAEIRLMSAPDDLTEEVLDEYIKVINSYEEQRQIERAKREIGQDAESIVDQASKLQELITRSRRLRER
ncbi:DNA primase [Exiguobacterium sp. SH1S4]|nr:DNA primase [Exiguobacterium sp. SH31]TCI39576.1 DNA primase [Exiguobacterium sp. SH4S7]TCI47729.1 DNA primase [Exiguobacterium sp. SH5S32]TCI54614.1 DNA primase [Exiguobacterium sp. SH1S4]TCI61464.1 DNA primase [Exiguobacterium sp. SH0S2]TCI73147.1 DNA primase [Exiguobacterium sp. SH0S7]TCI74409.1 DNA primase [Exiguobacterium sp. SH1S1]TCI80698.1 DNA primase [Exiguobacterium sp. SH0S1]